AYFGQIDPTIFAWRGDTAFDWFLPPALPGKFEGRQPPRRPLEPGLYAVSASLVRGLPWRVYDKGQLGTLSARAGAFGYFRALEPIGHVGYSIWLYRVSKADVARLAPLWAPPRGGPG